MGILHSGNSNKPNIIPFYTGLQIQTSANAVPISIVYGTNRCAPNAMWSNGFFGVPQYTKSGGKGGGKSLSSYEYYTSFALGICEGEIAGYGSIFSGQNIYASFWQSIWWNTGLDFSTKGTQTQTPWGFISAAFPFQALSYKGLAYVGAIAYDLGSSPILPQFSFEIRGILHNSSVVNPRDADPALIIQDFLTNAQYGVGFPGAGIDATSLLTPSGSTGDSSYQTYCRAALIALSPVLSNWEAANRIIARWLTLTNSEAVWSGGKLKFIPYGDTAIMAAVPFSPNLTPIYDLSDDDFIHEDGNDPVEITRIDPYSLYNWQRIQISQRTHNYNSTPIDVWDQNSIELYGLRMASDITASEICEHKVGQIVAQLILQRQLYIRNTYKFKLSFEYCLLEPMDLVTLTDANLGLHNVAVRITEIEEDESGILGVTAEEFPAGTASAVAYPVQTNGGNSTNLAVIPARVNQPIIFEPPASLTNNVAQIWAAVSGGIATVYKLAETSSSGKHLARQTMVDQQASGQVVVFSVYVSAVERAALRLNFDDSNTDYGCDFNLTNVTTGTPDTWGDNQLTATIDDAGITGTGEQWYQCTITAELPSTMTPVVNISLEQSFGTNSYSGTSGNGLYFWGAAYSTAGEAPTYLPTFTSATGATLATGGIDSPEGPPGVADPNWGGCNVWISTDNATFGQIGQVTAPARQGVLVTSTVTPTDTSFTVNLEESGGQLASATAADAGNGVTLCLLDNELLAYETATLQPAPPPNTYALTGVVRAFYGTAAATHSAGALFTRVDSAVFRYDLPAGYIDVPIYMKFQSFNIFGQAVEDLSECTVFTYTPSGAGSPAGPATAALATGQSLDFGLVSAVVSETDQWGVVTDGFLLAKVDLGVVI